MTDPELLTDRARPAIRVERRYDHPIERVWRAVTTPGSLAQWFPAGAEFELTKDGEARFGDMEGASATGRVLEVDPPRYLAFTWDEDRIEFELRQERDQTLFVLTHHFDDLPGAASFATGWEMCLAGLGDVLAGGEPVEPASSVDRHEQLVAHFRLDRPEITRTGTGWRAEFERQLTCPAETAWDLFLGTDPTTGAQLRAPAVGEELRSSAAPEVVLGTVTEVDAPRALSFAVADRAPGDEVRLRLGQGTGHGARLFLDVRGTDPDELDDAVEQWGGAAIPYIAHEGAKLANR